MYLRAYLRTCLFFLLPVLLLLPACAAQSSLPPATEASNAPGPERPVRNVIYMIGDGMSFAQMSAGRLSAYGTTRKLNIEMMPVTGVLHTHALDNLITDSAAGATALACGVKTSNGMISMLPDGSKTESLLERLRDMGHPTGLVATSTITHATPACFAAHVTSRKFEPIIARQLVGSGVDVLLGGGKQFFIPKSDSLSKRPDELDLLAEARGKGYTVVETAAGLRATEGGRVLGLFAAAGLTHASSEPSVAEMTGKALKLLRNKEKGFFLMVEGSQIDWGGHANDLDYVIREMLAFDEAVKVALDFAEADGNTLVIVTADHETGGLAINGGNFDGSELQVAWTTGYHTGLPVGIFAYGPHSLRFTGVHDNTAVAPLIAGILGISNFPRIIPPAASANPPSGE